MLSYDAIMLLLEELQKYAIIETIKKPDINSSFIKEMYKNGNVKTYESSIKLTYPRVRVVVKNKDFEKYSASFHEAIDYLKLVFLSNFYEKRVKQFYLLMGRVHKKRIVDRPFSDLLTSSYKEQNEQHYDPQTYVQAHYNKPTIYDRKYIVNEYVKSRKKYKQELRNMKQLFEEDIAEYEQKIIKQQGNKLSFYQTEYKLVKENTNITNKISKIKHKYTTFEKGYLLMNNEDLIEHYFTYLRNENLMLPSFHNERKSSFFIDLDSKAIILNLGIPTILQLPDIDTLTIIRKRLTCKTTKIDPVLKDRLLASYILATIRIYFEMDTERKFETIYMNLFKSDGNCYGLLKIHIDDYKKQMKSNLDPIIFLETLSGIHISYESLTTKVLPLQKGGI